MSPDRRVTTPAQRRGIWLTVIAALAFSALLLVSFIHGLNTAQLLSEEELQEWNTWLFERPRELADMELVDQHGRVFDHQRLEGQWSLLFFGFTHCPDICPATLAQLTQLLDALPDEVVEDTQVVLVSVDPARDRPERLAEYLTPFHPDFVGVTGEFMALQGFATQLGSPFVKLPGGGEDYHVEHSANIVLINPRGHFVGFFRPPHEVDRLALAYQSVRALR